MFSKVRGLSPWLRCRSLSSQCTSSTSAGSTTSSNNLRSSMLALKSDKDVSVSDINSRLNTLHLTASYLSGTPLARLEISLPTVLDHRTHLDCPTNDAARRIDSLVVPDALTNKIIDAPAVGGHVDKTIEAPAAPNTDIVKQAHRMLRIRKRKMKVHWRKRRAKRDKAKNFKIKLTRRKNKEVAFRLDLLSKIKRAKKFDAGGYVEEKLEGYKIELTPGTYKGKRLPEWLIKELLVEDELKKETEKNNQLDILTKEKLIKEGETVEQFVARMDKVYKR